MLSLEEFILNNTHSFYRPKPKKSRPHTLPLEAPSKLLRQPPKRSSTTPHLSQRRTLRNHPNQRHPNQRRLNHPPSRMRHQPLPALPLQQRPNPISRITSRSNCQMHSRKSKDLKLNSPNKEKDYASEKLAKDLLSTRPVTHYNNRLLNRPRS